MVYKYNKLVRDKIPQTIEELGKKCNYYVLNEKEYKQELDKKLLEETNEFIADHSIEEMADLMEVIEAIQKSHGLEKDEIERNRLEKGNKKGFFNDKLYLVDVQEEQNNIIEDNNRENTQMGLWQNLQSSNTLREVQQYIKAVIKIRGFSEQEIEKTMLLLLEEVGELAKSIRKNATNMSIDKNKINHYGTIESEIADDCL